MTKTVPTDLLAAMGLANGGSHALQVLDAISDMVLVKGPKSRIVWANKAFRDCYGMTNEQLQGLIDAEFNEPDITQQYVRDDAHVFATGCTLDIPEEPVTRHDGEQRLVHTVKSPIRDEDGNVVMVVAVCRDITDSKQTETRLKIAERMASIGTLAAGVAHELNNPLTYVQLNLQECRATLDSATVSPAQLDEVREMLADIADGTERVRLIVRDLKTFSREEACELRVDLKKVLENTSRMAGNEIRHRARLVIETDGPLFVDGNEAQLSQVFLNLLTNAAHAMPESSVATNEIRIVARTTEAGQVSVEVRDNGRGIPAENLGRLFDPFFTTKPLGQGTGLGLSIVHNLVTQHRGTLGVRSTVGKGTVFEVLLPPGKLDVQVITEEIEPPAAARPRVLAVDDEPRLLTILGRVLSASHDVVACTDAEQALAKIAAGERFDVVLCDVEMPGMSGARLYEEVRRIAKEQSDRFLFMTGGAFTSEGQRLVAETANQRIDKPVRAAALNRAIRELLERETSLAR